MHDIPSPNAILVHYKVEPLTNPFLHFANNQFCLFHVKVPKNQGLRYHPGNRVNSDYQDHYPGGGLDVIDHLDLDHD